MLTNKQHSLRGGLAGLALLLCGALACPAQAQSSGNLQNRSGDKPDTTTKTTSVPQGVKKDAKKDAKKTATTDKKGKTSGKMPIMAKRLALVFPVDAKGAAAEQLSDIITDVEKARLSTSGMYSGISFLTSLPSIRRAVNEQSLTQADVQPPFATRTKAQKLTMAAGYDIAVISSMDSYEYSADNQNVTMVLSIQMIDFSGDTPRNYTAADTVTTAPKSAKNAADTTASEPAARSLAEKLMTTVLNSAKSAKAPSGGTGTTPVSK